MTLRKLTNNTYGLTEIDSEIFVYCFSFLWLQFGIFSKLLKTRKKNSITEIVLIYLFWFIYYLISSKIYSKTKLLLVTYCVTPQNGMVKRRRKKTQTQLENFYSKKLQSHVKFWSSSSAWNQDELACLLRWDAL